MLTNLRFNIIICGKGMFFVNTKTLKKRSAKVLSRLILHQGLLF